MRSRATPNARGTLRLAVTLGDPAGIGPEVVLKALHRLRLPRGARLVVIGSAEVLRHTARRLRLPLPDWMRHPTGAAPRAWGPSALVAVETPGHVVPGRSSAATGAASLAALREAVALWRRGTIHALVTGPVTKWAVQRVEPRFRGQTEWLAEQTGAPRVAMMFVCREMRVVVLTRHEPLCRVPALVTEGLLVETARLVHGALRRQFGIRHPRLAVCGLNPHAGERGRIGREELTRFRPALARLKRARIDCAGPFAADGFFAGRPAYDAILCPYHDQGLIPFKLLARDRGCQVSLGLPFIRTSPDHGTALDIAGRGSAEAGSLQYALRLACQLAGAGRA